MIVVNIILIYILYKVIEYISLTRKRRYEKLLYLRKLKQKQLKTKWNIYKSDSNPADWNYISKTFNIDDEDIFKGKTYKIKKNNKEIIMNEWLKKQDAVKNMIDWLEKENETYWKF